MNVLIGGRMREYLGGRGIPRAKLRVIENWADGDAIQPKTASTSALRARLGTGGLLRRWLLWKFGQGPRIRHPVGGRAGAARGTRLRLPDDRRRRQDYRLSSKRSHDTRRSRIFRFLPYQPRREALADSLATADVHLVSLLPPLEGLIVPSKLYGILAGGRPLIFIGDPDGEVGRVIRRAECGRLVTVGDSQALVESIRELAAEPELRALMGARARKILCEEFSLRRAIERWLVVIEEIP